MIVRQASSSSNGCETVVERFRSGKCTLEDVVEVLCSTWVERENNSLEEMKNGTH